MLYIQSDSDTLSLHMYVFGYCVEFYITSFRLYVFCDNNDLRFLLMYNEITNVLFKKK